MMHKAWCGIEEVPYCFSKSSIKFQGHTGWKIDNLNPVWVRLLGRSQLSRYFTDVDQATSHYLNQWWLVYWCIYSSLGLNELIGLPVSHYHWCIIVCHAVPVVITVTQSTSLLGHSEHAWQQWFFSNPLLEHHVLSTCLPGISSV